MKHKTTIFIFLILQFSTAATMSMVMALGPSLATLFKIPLNQVPQLNIGFVLAGLTLPIFGVLADKRGMKLIIIFGSVLYSIGCLAAAFTSDPVLYFFYRSLIGFGYYAVLGLISGYSAHLVDEKTLAKLSGYYKLAFSFGVFVSPILGAIIISTFGFTVLYGLLGIIGVITSCLLLGIPNVKDPNLHSFHLSDIKVFFKTSRYRWFMLVAAGLGMPGAFFFNFLNVHLSDIGYNQTMIANIYTLVGLGSILSGVVIIWLHRVMKMSRLLLYGTIGVMFALALTFYPNKIIFIIGAFLFGLTYDLIFGLIYPVSAILVDENKASFISIVAFLMTLFSLSANVFGPYLYTLGGFNLLSLIGFGSALIGCLGLLKVYTRKAL